MPFALLIVGILLLIAGVKNTQGTLYTLVQGDFTGQDNFLYWFTAILVIGAIGYVPKLKPLSTGFLILVILVLFLKKGNSSGAGGGFFAQITSALGSTTNSSSVPASSQLSTLQSQQAGLINAISSNLLQSSSLLSQDIGQ